jgi:predicted nucleic acid-binding protein
LREGASLETVKKRLIFIEAKTTIVEITVEITIKAAEKYLELLQRAKKTGERQPSLADAVVYATALYLGTKLVTGDKLFKLLPHVIYIGD